MDHDKYGFVEARDKLPSAASSLPTNYKKDNAAALLDISENLKRSYHVELKLISLVSNLDLSDIDEVTGLANYLRLYEQMHDLQNERTHCHNIGRIAKDLMKRYQTGDPQDKQKIEEMDSLLKPLSRADHEMLDNLEPLVTTTLQTVLKIEELARSDLGAAQQEQREFRLKMGERHESVKKALRELNQLSNELIDLA
jgi:hypothetical protein